MGYRVTLNAPLGATPTAYSLVKNIASSLSWTLASDLCP